MTTKISLSDHFTYGRLLRFTTPVMATAVFLSIYSLVDGFFVSNYVNKTAFAAVNLVFPFVTILGVIGTMLGTGGSALVGKLLGEGKSARANQVFSMLVWLDLLAGIVLAAIGFALIPTVSRFMGASGQLLADATLYGRILTLGIPLLALQSVFQSFLVTAERPTLGFVVNVAAGVTNVVLDALFIIGFDWGLTGAAVATFIGEVVGGLIPLIYFLRPNTSLLQLCPAGLELRPIFQASLNGLSEFVSSISSSIVGMLYNYQLMRYLGEDGVAAFGVAMYVGFIFLAIIFGFSMGASPLISFNFGAENHREMSNIFRKSLVILLSMGATMTLLAWVFAPVLAEIFVGYDEALVALTVHALSLYMWAFLIMGISIFGSAFFTALNNGPVSAAISFTRAIIFECAFVLIMPPLIGANGIWLAMPLAEVASVLVTIGLLIAFRNRYGYGFANR